MALTGLVAANNLGDVVDIEKTWDNIGNNISASVFVPSPTLDLNFASNKSLIDNVSGQNLITFTRPSTGTFVGSNGLIQTAASGVPRFDHNPATGESLGLLIEEARTNFVLGSNTGGPTNPGTGVTVSTSGVGPDGVTSATQVTVSGGPVANTSLRWTGAGTGTWSGTSTNVRSFYVKVISGSGSIIQGQGGGGDEFTWNLATLSYSSDSRHPTGAVISVGNGWYRCWIGPNGPGGGGGTFTCPINNGTYLFWGFQTETGSFPTSYIPTSGSQATRVADTVSIAGSNFSSWYRNSSSTFVLRGRFISRPINQNTWGILSVTAGGADNNFRMRIGADGGTQFSAKRFDNGANYEFKLPGSVTAGSTYNYAVGYDDTGHAASSPLGFSSITYPALPYQGATSLTFVPELYGASHTVARLTYYPIRLSNITLQALTTYGPVSSFPYSFSIKGRDILSLKEVNKTSTRDFIFTKGLLSRAQPRITTASQYTSSGVALRDAAMLKFAPVTRGNYLFSSGLTLSGATVQINGTNAQSIATSPFTGSGATVPLLFAGLRPQTNWRISETMASGVVASPESAIPIETSDFLLFMKAGQS